MGLTEDGRMNVTIEHHNKSHRDRQNSVHAVIMCYPDYVN